MPEVQMCPLKAIATAISLSDSDGYEDTCSEERCGWYDKLLRQCCVQTIAESLGGIRDCLESAHSEDYTIGKAEDEVYESAAIPKDDEPF